MEVDYRKAFDALNRYIDEMDNANPRKRGNYVDYLLDTVNGYYLSDSVSEEKFLDVCDYVDNELYDDYKDMYSEGAVIYAIPLEHYIYALQEATGKRPERTRRWIHLDVKAAGDEA